MRSSVTGVASGSTGSTSTEAQSSPGAVGSGRADRETRAMPTTAFSSVEW